jgi:hypothetical protein
MYLFLVFDIRNWSIDQLQVGNNGTFLVHTLILNAASNRSLTRPLTSLPNLLGRPHPGDLGARTVDDASRQPLSSPARPLPSPAAVAAPIPPNGGGQERARFGLASGRWGEVTACCGDLHRRDGVDGADG